MNKKNHVYVEICHKNEVIIAMHLFNDIEVRDDKIRTLTKCNINHFILLCACILLSVTFIEYCVSKDHNLLTKIRCTKLQIKANNLRHLCRNLFKSSI